MQIDNQERNMLNSEKHAPLYLQLMNTHFNFLMKKTTTLETYSMGNQVHTLKDWKPLSLRVR